MKKYRQLILSLGIILSTPTAYSAISFNFTYGDDTTGFGFDDATFGASRKATVEAVGNYINTVLDHTATVDVAWDVSTDLPSGNTLGSMGTYHFIDSGISNGFMFDHITTGTDPDGLDPDAFGRINFGRNWNSETDPVAAGEFDLFTVVLHEITHALGGASLIAENGTPEITGTYSFYDTLLRDSNGDAIVNSSGAFVGSVASLTSNDLHILLDGQTYDVYAPSTWEGGSSISHFDSSIAAVMNPSIATNVQKREYTSADLAMLQSLGYNLQVPEPSSVFLVGLGSLALILRRRK